MTGNDMAGKEMTGSVLNYIFAIETLSLEKSSVRSVDVSKKTGVARSSVCKAIDKLTDLGYARRDEKGEIKLTSLGERVVGKYSIAVKAMADVFKEKFNLNEERAKAEAVRAVGALSCDTVDKIVDAKQKEGLCR